MTEHDTICTYGSCMRRRYQDGLCAGHFRLRENELPMDTPLRPPAKPPRPCRIPGCTRRARAHDLCGTHYYRKKNGVPNPEGPITRRMNGPERKSIGSGRADLVERLDAKAKARGMTRAWLLDVMLETFLSRGDDDAA